MVCYLGFEESTLSLSLSLSLSLFLSLSKIPDALIERKCEINKITKSTSLLN